MYLTHWVKYVKIKYTFKIICHLLKEIMRLAFKYYTF